eukprot:566260-Rhodomonas_salina.1
MRDGVQQFTKPGGQKDVGESQLTNWASVRLEEGTQRRYRRIGGCPTWMGGDLARGRQGGRQKGGRGEEGVKGSSITRCQGNNS